jgi:hypothetical protein
MAKQAAFDTSWMNLGAEAFLDAFHQIRQSNGWFLLAYLANECEDLLGELVRLLGTALVGHQAGKTIVLESRLCLIERRPGKAEVRGRIRHRLAFGPRPPEHFVFDLDQIARIEEIVLEKQWVAYRMGARVEGSLLLEGADLWVRIGHWRLARPPLYL